MFYRVSTGITEQKENEQLLRRRQTARKQKSEKITEYDAANE